MICIVPLAFEVSLAQEVLQSAVLLRTLEWLIGADAPLFAEGVPNRT